MRLSDSIEASGYFWLPEDDTRKVPGQLTISSTGRVELILTSLTEFHHVDDPSAVLGERSVGGEPVCYRRIVGLVNSDKMKDYVTLEECHRLNSETSLGTKLSTTIIEAMFAFIGVAYSSDERIEFSELRFSMIPLDEWLNISGVGISPEFSRNNKLDSITIQYSPPPKRKYSIPDDMTLEINFDSTVPIVPRSTETKILQRARISIRSTAARSLDSFLEVVRNVQYLLGFCIDALVPLDLVEGYSNEIIQELSGGRERRIPIKIYFRTTQDAESDADIRRHNMLLSYVLIEQQFEDVLQRWLAACDQFRPTFDLFFGIRVGAFKYVEGQFLSLVQALEYLHRRQIQGQELPTEEFNNIIDGMLETVPLERRTFIQGKLKYANEPTLRKRLREMFSPYWSLYEIGVSRNKLVGEIVDTRNFLTHYSDELKSKAASGLGLFELNQLMEALLQLHMLNILGLDRKAMEDIVENNGQLRWKLGAKKLKVGRE